MTVSFLLFVVFRDRDQPVEEVDNFVESGFGQCILALQQFDAHEGHLPDLVDITKLCLRVRQLLLHLCGDILSDNGLPALVFGNEVEEAASIPTQEGGIYNFAAYNLFVPVAARLLKGTALRDLGTQHPQLLQRPHTGFLPQGEYYRIYVHYIDDYGNAYLGMSYREFEELRQGRPFELQVKDMFVTELSPAYQKGTGNDTNLRLTVSATGQLELALQRRSLTLLLGLHVNDSVLLRFK